MAFARACGSSGESLVRDFDMEKAPLHYEKTPFRRGDKEMFAIRCGQEIIFAGNEEQMDRYLKILNSPQKETNESPPQTHPHRHD